MKTEDLGVPAVTGWVLRSRQEEQSGILIPSCLLIPLSSTYQVFCLHQRPWGPKSLAEHPLEGVTL